MKRCLKVMLVLLLCVMPFVAVDAKSKTTTETTTKATEKAEKTTEKAKEKTTAKKSEKTTAKKDDKTREPINFYVFYGNGCPHCEDLLNYLDELAQDKEYNFMYKVVKYETWYNTDNATLMTQVFNYFGVTDSKQMGVPLYVIGDKNFTGFPDPENSSKEVLDKAYNEIKEALKAAYYNDKYVDVVAGIGSGDIDVDDSSETEKDNNKKNDIIGYIIIGVVVIIVVAIIFGRSKSDTYVPVEEVEEDEEEAEETEEETTEEVEEAPVKEAKEVKTTKTTSTKKKTTKKNTKKK